MRQLTPALVVALVVALVFVGLVNGEALAQGARQTFGWVIAKRLTVDTTAAIGGAATVGGALAVTGGASAASLSTTGDVSVGALLNTGTFVVEGGGGNLDVTGYGPLTAVRSFQQLTATGTSGMTLTVLPKGTVVKLLNMANQTITISDTGTTMLASNAALGQYDTLTVISDGTNMVEIARANN